MRKVTATSIYAVGMCSVMDIRVIQILIEDYKFPIEMFMFRDKYLPCIEVLPKVYHPLSDYVSYVRGVLPDIPLESIKKFPRTLNTLDVTDRNDLQGCEETEIVEFPLDGYFNKYLESLKGKNRYKVKKYSEALLNKFLAMDNVTDTELDVAIGWFINRWMSKTIDYGIPCYDDWYTKVCTFIKVTSRLGIVKLYCIRDEITYDIVGVYATEIYNDTCYYLWAAYSPNYTDSKIGHLMITAAIQEAFLLNCKAFSIGAIRDFQYKSIYQPLNVPYMKGYNYDSSKGISDSVVSE